MLLDILDVLKDFDELLANGIKGPTYALVLLAVVVQFTDIPQVIINWIRNIWRPTSLPDWTTKPYRRPLVYPIIGKYAYRKSKIFLQKGIKEFIHERTNYSVLKELLSKEGINYAPSYEYFHSRKSKIIPNEQIALISGLPGTGKSSFVSKHIEKLHNGNNLDFLIPLNRGDLQAKFSQLLKPLIEIETLALWQVIHDKARIEQTNLSPITVSYILNYHQVYFIIEDIHNIDEIKALNENFNKYINKYHSENKKFIKLIITSRNIHLSPKDLGDYDSNNIIKLDHLTTEDCEFLFFKYCKELNLAYSENFNLLVSQEKSPTKFEDPFTKNPLVIDVLTALLYFNRKEKLNIQIFTNSVVGIFQQLTNTLCDRCGINQGNNKAQFDIIYQDLAHQIRILNLEGFDGADVPSIVNQPVYNLHFLATNGFIGDNGKAKKRYFFLHQTILDILFINFLIRQNNYKQLSIIPTVGEEYIFYLQDQLQSVEQYENLIRDDLRVATRVMDNEFFKKITRNNLGACIYKIMHQTVLSYLNINYNEKNALMYAISLIKQIQANFSGSPSILLQAINTTPASVSLLQLLLQLNEDQVKQYILQLAYEAPHKNIFSNLIDQGNSEIHEMFVFTILNPNIEPKKKVAICLIYLNTKHYESKKTHIVQNLLTLYSSAIYDALFQEEEIRKYIIKECLNIDINTSQRISYYFRQYCLNGVLIPKGKYTIGDEEIIITNTIIVSRYPQLQNINGNDLIEARRNALNLITEAKTSGLNQFPTELWTYNHLAIAYRYFNSATNANGHGIIGMNGNLLLNHIKYEAYQEDNYSDVNFAYLEGDTQNNALVPLPSSNTQQIFNNRVIFRSIIPS